jgi:hypothetical protein
MFGGKRVAIENTPYLVEIIDAFASYCFFHNVYGVIANPDNLGHFLGTRNALK